MFEDGLRLEEPYQRHKIRANEGSSLERAHRGGYRKKPKRLALQADAAAAA